MSPYLDLFFLNKKLNLLYLIFPIWGFFVMLLTAIYELGQFIGGWMILANPPIMIMLIFGVWDDATLVTEPRVISDYVSFCLAEETTRIMPSLTLYGSGSRIHTWGADSVVIDVPSEDENIIFMYYVYCFQPNGTVGVPIVFLNYDFDRSAYDDRLNPNTATLTASVNELNILYAKLTVAYNNLKQIVGQENIQIKNYQDQKDLELQQINQKYSLLIANATADATVKKNKIQTEQIDPLTISANATKHQLIALNGGTLPSGVILPILD